MDTNSGRFLIIIMKRGCIGYGAVYAEEQPHVTDVGIIHREGC